MAKRKSNGRGARWADACSRAMEAKEDLEAALEELKGIQEEYQDWYDNMPENLQQGPTGEKLQELQNLDLSIDLSVVDEANDADLPLGFGRD